MWLLHPGPGTVTAVDGLDAVRAMPGVVRVQLRAEPGTRVGARLGAGQETGHIVVVGNDRDQAAGRLTAAYERLHINVQP